MARKKQYQFELSIDDIEENTIEKPSRSQKKRDSTALQKIGEELVALPLSKVKRLPISPELLEAFELMARISNKEGRRRQMQYIGKLMRECSLDELRPALDSLRQGSNEGAARLQHAERLREALLTADSQEEERIIKQWPTEEHDEIYSLLSRARKEDATHAKRALFRKLHSLL